MNNNLNINLAIPALLLTFFLGEVIQEVRIIRIATKALKL